MMASPSSWVKGKMRDGWLDGGARHHLLCRIAAPRIMGLVGGIAFSARSRGSLKLFHWAGVTWVVDWMR